MLDDTVETDDTAQIYHLADRREWLAAIASGTGWYDRSTIGLSLLDEGFIHASSSRAQADRVIERYGWSRAELVLLVIDTSRVDAEIRLENLTGGDELFPHIYGPLAVAAVVAVLDL